MAAEEPNPQPAVIDYEGSDYQTSFWEEGGREYEDRVEAIALKRLLPPSGNLLLEIGAGAGRNTLRYTGVKKVVLLDYSISQLRQAQKRLGRKEEYIYVAADVYRLPFVPGLFDAATMIRVLHHIVDSSKALAGIREVMQPKGIFILEYANKQNLKAILRYWLRRQEWNPFSLDQIEFVELNFNFHPKQIRAWLGEAGFNPGRQLTVSHFRLGFLKKIIPTGLLVAKDSVLQFTGGLFQVSPSVFVRSRAAGESPLAQEGTFFRCPECRTPLADNGGAVLESECGLKWAIEDGIYNFKEPVK